MSKTTKNTKPSKTAKAKGPAPDETINNPDVVAKYQAAGAIANAAIAYVRSLTVAGATTYDICVKGDEFIVAEIAKVYTDNDKIVKGIAFPTCANPNQIPAHVAPLNEQEPANFTLKDGDVVNIMLGAQIDGYPGVVAETVVIGESASSPIVGRKADLVQAAWAASEAAINVFAQSGKKNWDVTSAVDKVASDYGVIPVDSMLSHNIERNVLYGTKEIILNPSPKNRSQVETVKFEQNEVYGLDILMSTSATGKVKDSVYRPTLYKLTGSTYHLKMKMSVKMLAELTKRSSGPFPANIRTFDESHRARGGLAEPSNHRLVLAYDVMTDREGEFIAQYFTTFGITKEGVVKFTSPQFNSDLYKSDKAVSTEAPAA